MSSIQKYYILDGKVPKPVDTLLEWVHWMEGADRHVADELVGSSVRVSTVFLGLDHRHGRGPPLLFETMIFGGEHDGYRERCGADWELAEAMHRKAVMLVRSSFKRARSDA